jgi:VWFA-related protein
MFDLKKSKLAIFFIFLFLILSYLLSPQESEKIPPYTHKVSVDIMLVPVFAIGQQGEPIFDLKREDFLLYANDTPVKITQFLKYEFGHKKEIPIPEQTISAKRPPRAVFLIIDSVFNSVYGYRRAKKIAIDIINSASPEDKFSIIENRAGGSPRYIAGPEEKRSDMIKKIKALKLPSGKWNKNLFLTREWNYEADTDAYDAVHNAASYENLTNREKYVEKIAYKNQVQHFARFLSQLKYALKTITLPKVVFLISEGISKAAFKNLQEEDTVATYYKFHSAFLNTEKRVSEKPEFRDMRLFFDLQKIVQAMNSGGSILYTLNPGKFRRDDEASGEMSLRFLAHESGGQYIAGQDPKKIIEKVKQTTAAYYELFFTPNPDLGDDIIITVKCRREGVKINSLKQTERVKPYLKMEKVQKKLFVYNLITGGSWSRMLGKVVRTRYKKLRNEKQGNETYLLIEIQLPEKMKNQKLDMFLVQMNQNTKKINIEMLTQKVTNRVNLLIKKLKNSKDFFVIIEPVFTYCIYNQV